MTDEDELRRRLAQAAPEAPWVPGRGAAVVARVRVRRRAATVATVCAVVAAVAVPFAARAVLSGDRESSASRPGRHLATCPVGFEGGEVPFDLPLTSGAVAAKVCNDPLGLGTPSEVLTTGVQQVVDQINALPTQTEPPTSDMICPGYFARVGVRPAILFEYPDGSVRGVGPPFCSGVNLLVGGSARGNRADVQNLLVRYAALVHAQERPGSPHRVPAVQPTCDDRPLVPVEAVPEAVSGVACVTLRRPVRRNLAAVPVPAHDLAVLLRDVRVRLAGHGTLGARCRRGTAPWIDLVVADASGIVTRVSTCGRYPTSAGMLESAPSYTSRRILDRFPRTWPP